MTLSQTLFIDRRWGAAAGVTTSYHQICSTLIQALLITQTCFEIFGHSVQYFLYGPLPLIVLTVVDK